VAYDVTFGHVFYCILPFSCVNHNSLMLYINVSSLWHVTGQINLCVIATFVFHSSFTFDSANGQIH